MHKAMQNVEIEVVYRAYRSPKVIGNITIRQNAYDFLFEFNRNYEAISYRFRDIIAYFPNKCKKLSFYNNL